MSDETTRNDTWSSSEAPQEASGPATDSNADRVGFCQDCGRPLTAATVRAVGTGVFCEPCLTTRVAAANAAYTTIPPAYAAVPNAGVPTPSGSEPSPLLAAILGFIPGVGAMYNGQFAKGIVHLVIFAVLVSLSDNVNGIFGLFVAGWEFYMAFEAYHTAVAKRDGLPLPNAFGFNDIGERMGFGKGWGATSKAGVTTTPITYPPAPPPPAPSTDWVGYVPPAAYTTTPPVPPAEPVVATHHSAPWGHAPYAETFTGDQPSSYAPPVQSPIIADTPSRRFPVGAIWLIGLGLLILVANLLPDWKQTERWWPPVLFAGLSVWVFTRRMNSGAKLICIIRWPVILMVLAIMFALHAAYLPISFGLTFSVVLIVFGALLLIERTAGASVPYVAPVSSAPYSFVPAAEEPARAAFVTPDEVASESPSAKDGQ